MKNVWGKIRKSGVAASPPYFDGIETLTDELEPTGGTLASVMDEIPHAEPGAFQAIKSAVKGHGEQTVLPDDCEFGDNDLCYVET
jgi:hypothetical protein